MQVNGHARLSKAVTSHQHTSIILYHTPAVAIDGVQGQHHANAHFPVTDIALPGQCRFDGSRLHRLRVGLHLRFRKRNTDKGALLQHKVRLQHLWVRLFQRIDRHTIIIGNTINSLLTFYLMNIAPPGNLCQQGFCSEKQHHRKQDVCKDCTLHFLQIS